MSRIEDKKSFIHAIKDFDGNWLHDTKTIQDEATTFYKNLVSSNGCVNDDDLLQVIPTLVSPKESSALTAIPDQDEIYRTFQSMPIHAFVGPNGFSLRFYLSAWDIIKNDMVDLVKFFFLLGAKCIGVFLLL